MSGEELELERERELELALEEEEGDWSSGAWCGATGQGMAGDDDAAGPEVDYLFTWAQRGTVFSTLVLACLPVLGSMQAGGGVGGLWFLLRRPAGSCW